MYHDLPSQAKGKANMATYKRTEIRFETEHVLIIRRRSTRRWCRECAREEDMAEPAEIAALTGVEPALLRQRAQAEKWHVSKASDGSLLICLNSFLTSGKKPRK